MGPSTNRYQFQAVSAFGLKSGNFRRRSPCLRLRPAGSALKLLRLAQRQLRLLTHLSPFTPAKLTPETRNRVYMRFVFTWYSSGIRRGWFLANWVGVSPIRLRRGWGLTS